MHVTVRFHARAADLAGTREIVADIDEPARCVDVKRALAARFPSLAGLVASSALATDREYVSDAFPVENGATLHFIPPVSGG